MRHALILVTSLALISGGCTSDGRMRDSKAVAAVAHVGASLAVSQGLEALATTPQKRAEVKRDADIAKAAIDGVMLPFLRGADISVVTQAATEQVLAQFENQLSPQIKSVIHVAIDAAITEADMPANTTGHMDDARRQLLIAIFLGVSEGIVAFDAE